MVMKTGYAIINFIKSEHATVALSRYQNANLFGMPLKLSLFKEDDLKKQDQT
jgi:hypothetical protein